MSDNGVGMSDADKENLFKLFYRGENKNIAPGNGIGMVLTQKIIQDVYKRQIWDWVDQGIYKELPDGRIMVAYGGDFGDKPNLKAFCFNGLLMSDRETTPKYWEVKKVYAPVQLAVNNGQLIVTNRNHHIDLSLIHILFIMQAFHLSS